MDTISIHALFHTDGINPNESGPIDPRRIMDSADVIIAVDVMSRRESLVFGRQVLASIVRENIARGVRVLRVELDMDTDELERLLALTLVVKGSHDYDSE